MAATRLQDEWTRFVQIFNQHASPAALFQNDMESLRKTDLVQSLSSMFLETIEGKTLAEDVARSIAAFREFDREMEEKYGAEELVKFFLMEEELLTPEDYNVMRSTTDHMKKAHEAFDTALRQHIEKNCISLPAGKGYTNINERLRDPAELLYRAVDTEVNKRVSAPSP